ncbi:MULTISPECIES: hypothetical protein [unclassified Legionella]|uniref:hypothetical protein n=1 Tax=unclassified Legionella TaxID=2622702 RepID=UPI001056227F|nr:MULTISPECIES: hypothetical protein [unclassified Legionella]MDI9818967.1 hypothetical protein [Legionella sp. PL877]
MLISELKKEIEKLNAASQNPHRLELKELLAPFKDEEAGKAEVTSKLKSEVYSILDNFWQDISKILPVDQWSEEAEVSLWMAFQKKLIEAKWEDAAHPLLYAKLAHNYGQQADSGLKLEELMPLIIRCSRSMGYADKNQLDDYPLGHMATAIRSLQEQRKEADKVKSSVTMLAVIFYLINHYCTAEQLDLLPQLIHYRVNTTDEERRSEQAIVRCIADQPLACQNFLLSQKELIEGRVLIKIEEVVAVSHLLPKGRPSFITALKENPWFNVLLRQSRRYEKSGDSSTLTFSVEQLRADFASLEEHSYLAALNFALKLKLKTSSFPAKRAEFSRLVLYLFALYAYVDECKADNKPDSFFSFSAKIKNEAALNKIASLTGSSVKLGMIERLALKQSRLVEQFEKQEQEITSPSDLNNTPQ